MRNKVSHNFHVESATRDETLVPVYGVAKSSPFKSIQSFHVITGLPPDIMHDILEGVIPVTLDVIIQQLIASNCLSRVGIKQRFSDFMFGKSDVRNGPKSANISVLGMSAAETWCVFRLFPFIVGDAIPQDNESWELYIYLARICDIIFAPTIEDDWIPYLDILVTDFYTFMKTVAPQRLRPKFHYLLHYPTLIKNFGPLRRLWCMRFESYHQKIKRVLSISKNFKNPCLTVAKRIQYSKCWEMMSSDILCEKTSFRGATTTKLINAPQNVLLSLSDSFISSNADKSIQLVNTLNHDSRKYLTGCVEVAAYTDEFPTLCLITHIFECEDWFLSGTVLKVSHFSRHFHSYVVQQTDQRIAFRAGSELTSHCLDIYQIESQSYVRFRYDVAKP